MAKIIEVDEGALKFDDGSTIHFDHCQDCCENNYADFRGLIQTDIDAEYNTNDADFLEFPEEEPCFYMTDIQGNKHKVNCYSEQNGYYSNIVDIYFNGEYINEVECEECIY